MASADHSKIEHIYAPKNISLGVDLYLDKPSGLFFATVGGKRIEKPTKDAAVKATREALDKITLVEWRQVIVLRVEKRNRERGGGEENSMHVFSASCSFTYFRRERAANPLKPKETIEREHQIEFEERVVKMRDRQMSFDRHARRAGNRSGKSDADKLEEGMRADRAALRQVITKNVEEFELPYTEEAWAGIDRIAKTLEDVQARLDTFAKTATIATLAALASGANTILQLPPAKESDR